MTKDSIAAYPCKKDAPSVVNIKEVYSKVQSRLERNEYIHDFINGIEGFPSQDVLRWINELRLDAEIAIAKNKNKTGYSCKIVSFTVGFYLIDVPKGKTLPQYLEHSQEECGVAFVNEAFYQDADPHGWIIVFVNTLPENLPFSSTSLSNDIQRAAHILKAAAPLLFPCTDFIIYGDTKCSYKDTSFINSRFFPNNRFINLWNNNKNDEIRLYVLQHPRRFFGLLKSEFEKTIHHMRFNRGEIEPTFSDINSFLNLTKDLVELKVPMIDAVCIAYETRKFQYHSGLSFNFIWMAFIEHYSMREQLSFNIAIDLAFSQIPDDFFNFTLFEEGQSYYIDKGVEYLPVSSFISSN